MYHGISLSIDIAGYKAEISVPTIVVTNDGPWGSVSRDAFGIWWSDDDGMVDASFPESLQAVSLELESHFSIGSGPLSSFDLPLSLDLLSFEFYQSIYIVGTDEFEIGGRVDFVVRDSDTDSDGVRDGLDQCPNTPAGKPIKANGCLEGDYNNDGDIDAGDLARFSEQFGLDPGL